MKKIVALTLLLSVVGLYPGFVADSLVKTVGGYRSIQDILIDDQVYTTTVEGTESVTKVVAKKIVISDRAIRFVIGGKQICCSQKQQFYDASKQQWVQAKDLQLHDQLLAANNQIVTIDSIERVSGFVTFYDISLAEKHLFFVSDQELIAHNFIPIVIGIACTFGEGAIVIESVTVGVCLVGLWLGVKHCGNGKNKLLAEPFQEGCNFPTSSLDEPLGCNYQHESDGDDCYIQEAQYETANSVGMHLRQPKKPGCLQKPEAHEAGKSCGGPNCKPRKGPYGYHIPSEKHPPKAVGNASPGLNTDEGQDALDVSVPVKNKDGDIIGRITVWGGRYVVFQETQKHPETWHNYMPVEWAELTQPQKNALRKNGLVKNNDSGKIIKDMKNYKKK